jgi:hypothetical protein
LPRQDSRIILATSAIARIAAKRSLRYEQSGWRLHLNHKLDHISGECYI